MQLFFSMKRGHGDVIYLTLRIIEHRSLNQKFKVKIWLRCNPTTTRFSFWDRLTKFNVTCRYFLIPEHGPKMVITHETFHFLLLILPKKRQIKSFQITSIETERYLYYVHNDNITISFCKMVDLVEKCWIIAID